MKLYTNPKNGEEVTTDLTPDQAAEICATLGSFPQDLAAKYARRDYLGSKFSDAQLFWLMKLAQEHIAPKEKPNVQLAGDAYTAIAELFSRVVGLQRPSLRFKTDIGTIRITINRLGRMHVTCGQAYQGEIVEDKFFYRKNCHDMTKTVVKMVAIIPEDAAVLFGQKSGCCCFCGRDLTTPESVTAGYGPVCADHWGLPWGVTGGEKVEVSE